MKITLLIITLTVSLCTLTNNANARYAEGAINADGDAPSRSTNDGSPSVMSTAPTQPVAPRQDTSPTVNVTITTPTAPRQPPRQPATVNNNPSTADSTSEGTTATDRIEDRRGRRLDNNDTQSGGQTTTAVDDQGCLVDFGCDISDPEYPKHEAAMTRARNTANANCSRCSNAERAQMINKVYFDELHRRNSSLPTGPMESMVYFTGDNETMSNFNNHPDNLRDMENIDRQVRRGDVGVIMPAQFSMVVSSLVSENFYSSMNDTQRLGVENAAIITSGDQLLDNMGAEAANVSFGGPGGTIILRNDFTEAQVRHEANHAGELAVFSIIEDTGYNSYASAAEREIAYEAANIIYPVIMSLSDEIRPEDCASCNTITGDNAEHLNTYHEARAYISEGDNLAEFENKLRTNLGLSRRDAENVAVDLMASSTISEQIEIISQAASILLRK